MTNMSDFDSGPSSTIKASIATKQQLLSNQELIATIAKVSETMVAAFKQGIKFSCSATAAALPTRSILPRSLSGALLSTARRCRRWLCL